MLLVVLTVLSLGCGFLSHLYGFSVVHVSVFSLFFVFFKCYRAVWLCPLIIVIVVDFNIAPGPLGLASPSHFL